MIIFTITNDTGRGIFMYIYKYIVLEIKEKLIFWPYPTKQKKTNNIKITKKR